MIYWPHPYIQVVAVFAQVTFPARGHPAWASGARAPEPARADKRPGGLSSTPACGSQWVDWG